MRWTTNHESNEYMKMRKQENLLRCKNNRNENWMKEKLDKIGLKWGRQSRWGYRLFDFWNHKKGIAVEVDGPEHNKVYDSIRDNHNYEVSRILVLRVRNRNESDADLAIKRIIEETSWNERRVSAGKKPVKGGDL